MKLEIAPHAGPDASSRSTTKTAHNMGVATMYSSNRVLADHRRAVFP